MRQAARSHSATNRACCAADVFGPTKKLPRLSNIALMAGSSALLFAIFFSAPHQIGRRRSIRCGAEPSARRQSEADRCIVTFSSEEVCDCNRAPRCQTLRSRRYSSIETGIGLTDRNTDEPWRNQKVRPPMGAAAISIVVPIRPEASASVTRNAPWRGASCRPKPHPVPRDRGLGATRLALTLVSIFAAWPVAAATALPRLEELSIEQLMNIQVTSVAKKEQSIAQSAAAIYVVTADEIRRSGLSSIPEVLRTVPGLDVAQINANQWAISARGFNDRFANKLLVLIDGRSVYNTTFAGTYWDSQDYVLEDIERIEVIRGPGGTVWGANAVNGVINIITKKSADTQGGLLTASAGDFERGNVALRYGGKLNESSDFRISANGFSRNAFGKHDGWNAKQLGFRLDTSLSSNDSLSFNGHWREGKADSTTLSTSLTPPSNIVSDTTSTNRDAHLMARWEHRISSRSEMSLQAYYDSVERFESILDQQVKTYDVEFQHRLPLGEYHDLTWGLGVRKVQDHYRNSFTIGFTPSDRINNIYSFFVQDEIALRHDLHLTLGTKFEHNGYTGFEAQPNARLIFAPNERQSYWAALSRAVQTPSRSYSDMRINVAAVPGFKPPFTPTVISVLGNPALDSQNVVAAELGYRNQLNAELSLDLAAFYNRYRNLTTTEKGIPVFEPLPLPAHLMIPSLTRSLMRADTHGLEVSANWRPRSDWRLSMGYAWMKMQAYLDPASGDLARPNSVAGSSPEQQLQLKSYFNLTDKLDLDTYLYFVDRLAAVRTTTPAPISLPSYVRLDLRLGYRPSRSTEISVALQNVLDNKHQEFSAVDIIPSEIPRSVYVKAALYF